MSSKVKTNSTVLDAIVVSLAKAAEYNANDQAAPAAILWTDSDRQWETIAPLLWELLPQFLTLGDYDPTTKTGPAIWLRCVIAHTLPDVEIPKDAVPIIYMPGVSNQELRAVEECPAALQPVVELQYRGTFWRQKNSRDWTIMAFLSSKDGGLGLEVAKDDATQEAMRRALFCIAKTSVEDLGGKVLEAADFDAMLNPDPIKQILMWMDDSKKMKKQWDGDVWESFRSVCQGSYGLDPVADGELVAAERLGLRENHWAEVWERFAESPRLYPNIPKLLRKAKPNKSKDSLFYDRSTWPQDNDEKEKGLRDALLVCRMLNPAMAAKEIVKLEAAHKERREWVWAKLGMAPLALAMEYLNNLAMATQKPLSGDSPKAMAEAYVENGYSVDLACLEAMAGVTGKDTDAVGAVLNAIYRPWLEAAAGLFQNVVQAKPSSCVSKLVAADDGCCILFADGLRYDIGEKLCLALQAAGATVKRNWRWAAVPTVTATAKPAVSPIAEMLNADGDEEDFVPKVKDTGKSLTTDKFRQLLEGQGYQVLGSKEVGNTSGKGWTEYGQIDSYGHSHGTDLPRHIDGEILGLVARVNELLAAGWQNVRIVTDHGWLLLPGGLPKTSLPSYLAATRWGRCAILKEKAKVDLPSQPWHWSKSVFVAFPRGIDAFFGGKDYDHGGLSVQECVIPDIMVTAAKTVLSVSIASHKWTGLRCRVEVSGEADGCMADIRTKPADSATSVSHAKPVTGEINVTLLVEDDDLIGTSAVIVIVDSSGQLVSKQQTYIGGKE